MSYSTEVLADSPVGYWKLTEPSGTTAGDSSGNSLSGTYHSVTLGATGLISGESDTAAMFNGSSSYADFGNPAALQITGQITLEAIISLPAFPSGGDSVGVIVGKGFDGTNAGYALQIQRTSGVNYLAVGSYQASGDVNYAAKVSMSSLSVNTPYHVVGLYDGSSWQIYINGGLAASTAAASGARTDSSSVFVGAWDQGGPARFLNGTAEKAAIYSTSLTLTRIQAHATAAGLLQTFAVDQMTSTATEAGVTLSITLSGGTAPYSVSYYRGTVAAFTSNGGSLIGTASGSSGALTFQDTTGTAGVTYYYQATATDSASGTLTTQTLGAVRRPPSVAVVWIGDSNMAGIFVSDPSTQAPPILGNSFIEKRTNRVTSLSNQGHSGSRPQDWVTGSTYLNNAITAMAGLSGTVKVFCIAIGTNGVNDTVAETAANYKTDVLSMIAGIRISYPTAYIFLNVPIYTSPRATNGITSYTNVDVLTQYKTKLQEIVSQSGDANLKLGDMTALETFSNHTGDWYHPETVPSGLYIGQFCYLHTNEAGASVWGELMGSRISVVINGEEAGGGGGGGTGSGSGGNVYLSLGT